jgi:hypothetical protein
MNRFLIAVAVVCLAAFFGTIPASAQTKQSGTALCAKPDQIHVIPVGDSPDHSLSVAQLKCSWTKPLEMAGAKSKDGVNTETSEFTGNTSRTHGFHVATTDSGDKYFVRYHGTGTSKDGALVSSKGTWEYTGGTGKLKGLTGKGTYSCTPSGDAASCEIEGEYQLPK